MAILTYPAVLERSASGYGVSFPDLPGCVSAGETYEAAVLQACDALSLHLEGMAADGEAYPERSSAKAVQQAYPDLWRQGGHIALILAAAHDRGVRVNVHLSNVLLDRIDRFSDAHGLNRSTFFAIAARQYLERETAAEVMTRYLTQTPA